VVNAGVPRAPDQRQARNERERAVLLQLAQATTPAERQRLQQQLITLGEWMPQIRAIAGRWIRRGLARADLEGAGLLGLLTAAARYDASRKHHGWATYATLWIQVEICKLARHSGPLVLETEREIRVGRAVRRAMAAGMTSAEEIAKKVKAPVQGVAEAMRGRRAAGWAALDRQAGYDHQEGAELNRGAIVRAWLVDLRERNGLRVPPGAAPAAAAPPAAARPRPPGAAAPTHGRSAPKVSDSLPETHTPGLSGDPWIIGWAGIAAELGGRPEQIPAAWRAALERCADRAWSQTRPRWRRSVAWAALERAEQDHAGLR